MTVRAALALALAALGWPTLLHAQSQPAGPQIVNVGGRAMRAMVAGIAERKPGQPLLVLEAGAGASGVEAWKTIFDDLARLGPVLAYDRRGLGESEADIQPQTYRRVAQSLHDLLGVMNLVPPYVLVGHSVGGVYIRGFSEAYPDGIVGYVYVEAPDFEATPEEKASSVPESERAKMLAPTVLPPLPPDMPSGERAEIDVLGPELVNYWPEARKLRQKLGVPVAVIIAAPPGRLRHPGDALMRLQVKHQTEWALQSSNGLVIVSGATRHAVQEDAPELVLLAVRHVLAHLPSAGR